jgi:protein-S-isoprenylcysteine O-methyltransferase Ste14
VLKLVSKFAFPAVLLALLVLLVRHSLFSVSPYVIGGQLIAVALNLWGRASFGKGLFRIQAESAGGPLMTHGPYRFVRHPMMAAALLFIWSSILGHWGPVNAVIGLVVSALIVTRIVYEERLLGEQYPEYIIYSKRTKRLIPYLL